MVEQLTHGHRTVAGIARDAFGVAEAANDQVTMDLLTRRMQIHEKTAWMLGAMIAA
jgi:starvation-inducible DNA-binding protein